MADNRTNKRAQDGDDRTASKGGAHAASGKKRRSRLVRGQSARANSVGGLGPRRVTASAGTATPAGTAASAAPAGTAATAETAASAGTAAPAKKDAVPTSSESAAGSVPVAATPARTADRRRTAADTGRASGTASGASGSTGRVSGSTGRVSGGTGRVSGSTGRVSGGTGRVSGGTGRVRSTGSTGRLATGSTSGTGRQRTQADGAQRRVAKSDINANFANAGVQTHQQVKQKAKQQKAAPARHARSSRRVSPLLIGGIAAAVVLLAVVVGVGVACSRRSSGGDSSGEALQTDASQTRAATEASVSFCAVGANIANADLLASADAWGGTTGDGTYDFSPLYEQMTEVIEGYDISFVNQATSLGGHDNFEYQGYPSYNTPDSMADAIADAGFDVANTNTNHTYDMWVSAVEHSQSVWAQHPEVTTIGSYTSQADRNDIRVLERNGMSVAFLSYCYGQNGYEQDDLPNDYYSAAFDKDVMRAEVERAKELADAVVVYMHWKELDDITGSTDTTVLSDQQQDYASYLAGLGVDLLIGCRGQTVGPVRYVGRGIRTTDGSGVTPANGMLCVYGLGDFASAYTMPSAVLSGMFTCDFVRDTNGEVSVQNPTWHPLVEHRADSTDFVCPLADYTAEQAASNELLARLGEDDLAAATTTDPLAWAKSFTERVVGDAIDVEA